MSVRILNHRHQFNVEWLETDGLLRDRSFSSYSEAERFAKQIECRLLIDSILDLSESRGKAASQ